MEMVANDKGPQLQLAQCEWASMKDKGKSDL